MFYKTKKKPAELFSLPNGERRYAFRIRPSAASPIEFAVRGQTVCVRDISAGGLSFPGVPLAPEDRETIVFDLPGLNVTVTATIEVVSVDTDGVVHCRFIDLTAEIEDEIHLYVLQRQKQIIRSASQEGEKRP